MNIPTANGLKPASDLLIIFLNKLKSKYFDVQRALLYSEGKKYIEIISILIQKENIQTHFKKIQFINLLSDEGLSHSCAEGCYTRLQNAANNLQHYNLFELNYLYQSYFQSLIEEIIQSPIIESGNENIISKISNWAELNPVLFEVHINNFMIKKFKDFFNIKFLRTITDNYINTIQNFFNRNPSQSYILDLLVIYLSNNFKRKFNLSGFVKYIAKKVLDSLPNQAPYMEKVKYLEENVFPLLGRDIEFSWDEIIDEVSGHFKNYESFEITISTRLQDQPWITFNSNTQFKDNTLFRKRNSNYKDQLQLGFEPFATEYNIYYSNLDLSWIKINNKRIKILEVIKKESGLQDLKKITPMLSELLDSLIQTPSDLIKFLNHLERSNRELIIKEIKAKPNFITKVIDYYYISENNILTSYVNILSQLEDTSLRVLMLSNFKEIIDIKSLLQTVVRNLSESPTNEKDEMICSHLIRKVSQFELSDLSNFKFYKSKYLNKPITSYLCLIDFSKINIDYSSFLDEVISCRFEANIIHGVDFSRVFATSFMYSKLGKSKFRNKLEKTDFSFSELMEIEFNELVQNDFQASKIIASNYRMPVHECNFSKASINKSFFSKKVVLSNFHSSVLTDINFLYEITNCYFVFAQCTNLMFIGYLFDNSFSSAVIEKSEFMNEVISNKFNFAKLTSSIFHDEIKNSIFTNSHLTSIKFEKNIFNCFFDDSFSTDVSFAEAVNQVKFINAVITNTEFKNRVYGCDFSLSSIRDSNFFSIIDNIKFYKTSFFKTTFFADIINCEFCEASFDNHDFSGITLYQNEFIKTNLDKAIFLTSSLSKISFIKSSLKKAFFLNTILDDIIFREVNIEYCVFKDIKIKGKVDFIQSNLRHTEFIDTDISLISFEESNVLNLKLTNAVISIRQLFDIFTKAGMTDFSQVLLNVEEWSKDDFLNFYQKKTLKGVILSDSIFNALIKLGYRNFSETDLSQLRVKEFIHYFYNLEFNFSKCRLPEINLSVNSRFLGNRLTNQHSILGECLSAKKRLRRSEDTCFITWQDIDAISVKIDHDLDISEVIIDSDAFINLFLATNDSGKKNQLLELISIGKFLDFSTQEELIQLKNIGIIKQKIYHFRSFFSHISQGIITENILANLLQYQYDNVAFNIAFIGGNNLLSQFSLALQLYGVENLGLGKVFLSKMYMLSSFFIKKSLSIGLFSYDLAKQFNELDTNSQKSFSSAISDILFISIDSTELGIQVLEYSTEINLFDGLEESVGDILNSLTLIGTQGYNAARKVEEIKKLIYLTPWDTFIYGLEFFLEINPGNKIQSIFEIDEAYMLYSKEIQDFLKNATDIKYYVIPTINLILDKNFVCDINDRVYSLVCKNEIIKNFIIAPQNSIYLNQQYNASLLFEQLNPLDNYFRAEQLFCNPYLIRVIDSIPMCESSIVVINNWAIDTNLTLFNLGLGRDIAFGFYDKSNIFIVNDGYKNFIGGDLSDHFIISATNLKGYFNAGLGNDLLDFKLYKKQDTLIVDLLQESFDKPSEITIKNFEYFLGRKLKSDKLLVNQNTLLVDLLAGSDMLSDVIEIASHVVCKRLEIVVRKQTFIINLAKKGNYIYIFKSFDDFPDGNNLLFKNTNLIFPNVSTAASHTFLFDFKLEDINPILFKQEMFKSNFLFNFSNNSNLANYSISLINLPKPAVYFFQNIQLKILEGNSLYAFLSSQLAVEELIEGYAITARLFEISFFIHQSVNNEMVLIGHSHHQVLQNDISAQKTHLIANGGKNIYQISSQGTDKSNFPLSDVILYNLFSNSFSHLLDLRELNLEIKNISTLPINITFSQLDEDIYFSIFTYLQDSKRLLSLFPIINIILKNGTNWYSQLNIIHNSVAFQLLKSQQDSFELHAMPLNFPSNIEYIFLTKEDVEVDQLVFLNRPMQNHKFLKEESDLWLTTLFSSINVLNENYTLCFMDFYNQPKMKSLTIKFTNDSLVLEEFMDDILNAENVKEKLASEELFITDRLKMRYSNPENDQDASLFQSNLLYNIPSHNEQIKMAMCSAAFQHKGFLNYIKMGIQMLSFKFGTLINSYACYFPTIFKKGITYSSSFFPNQNEWSYRMPIEIFPHFNYPLVEAPKSYTDYASSDVFFLPSFNAGILQLLDWAIRRYLVNTGGCSNNKSKKNIYSQKARYSHFFSFKNFDKSAIDLHFCVKYSHLMKQ